MFVEMWMTRHPVTVEPTASLYDARKLMKKHDVKRLPVVEDGKLVGIITLFDIVKATPSEATTLDIHEVKYILANTLVKDVMTRDLITVTPETTIEEAALKMLKHRIGGMPVVTKEGELVGIITETDIYRALIEVMGFMEKGVRLTFELEHKPGVLAEITRIIKEHNINILSLSTARSKDPNKRMVVIRIKAENPQALIEDLKKAGYPPIAQSLPQAQLSNE